MKPMAAMQLVFLSVQLQPRQRHWQNMQMGHLIQANLFCYMLPKWLTLQLNQNHENKEVGHAIGNAMFVVILGLGVIVGSRCIFWV